MIAALVTWLPSRCSCSAPSSARTSVRAVRTGHLADDILMGYPTTNRAGLATPPVGARNGPPARPRPFDQPAPRSRQARR